MKQHSMMASSHRNKSNNPMPSSSTVGSLKGSPAAAATMFKLLLFEPLFPALDLTDASHWKSTNGSGVLVTSDHVENLLGPSISEFQSLRFVEWLSIHLAQSQSFESW
jgi:hypothetical protein